jgi:uncharacterized protein YjbI with pentapeptide repeats
MILRRTRRKDCRIAVEGAVLEVVRSKLQRADVSGQNVAALIARHSTFESCSFAGTAFRGGDFGLEDVRYVDCDFTGADLRKVDPGNARFERCTFDGAFIEGWIARCAQFVGCRFATTVRDTLFWGRPSECVERRDRNDFYDNDFSKARLIDTLFVHGIELDKQKLPEGDDYLILDGATARIAAARAEVEQWNDTGNRRVALANLQTLASHAQEQDPLFVPKTYTLLPPLAAEELWKLLAR